MSEHSHGDAKLTRNQTLVLETLSAADGSLSAYTILDHLRDKGFRAPLQVYRALDRLVELGLVHRLETLNAFVVCRRSDCEGHGTVAFTICNKCDNVAELTGEEIAGTLNSVAVDVGFALEKSTVELRGVCGACRAG